MTDEEKFRSEVLIALARIELNQAAHTSVDKEHDRRITGLEHTVNGNGKEGLAEKVRNIYVYGATLCAGVMVLIQIFGEDIRRLFHRG